MERGSLTDTPRSDHPLDEIFHPRSIALIGVSSNPSGMSSSFLTSLLEQGYEKEHGLYPVNPKAEQIEGLRCYPSILDTPDPVDHVISLVPAGAVPGLVDQCIEKGVRSIHFFTAGFSETGDDEMARVERAFVERARAAGVRLIGPNCMGLYVPSEGIAFMNGFPSEPGNVFVLSQSGANAGDIIHGLAARGVRFSKAVSYGNGADLGAHDFLDYAAHDPQTEIVVAYVEGVRDGRRFFEALQRCARVKPVVLLKGGIHDAGARAAHSHTGSLAGSIAVFDAACRQSGAIRAETMDDLHDLVVALSTDMRRVAGRGVALVSGGGGFAVLSSDAIATAGLEVPPMPQSTIDELREFIPVAGTSVNNPIDSNVRGREAQDRTMRIVAAAGPIDVVFSASLGGFGGRSPWGDGGDDDRTEQERHEAALRDAEQSVEDLATWQRESGVPFVGVLRERGMGSGGDAKAAEHFVQGAYRAGVGVFPSVPRAARTIALLLAWRERREGLPELF